jgi:putative transposase
MSCQNYYARRHQYKRLEVDEEFIYEQVLQMRQLQPRLGGRKLFVLLKLILEEAGIRIGRDRFFEILKRKGLLLQRKLAQWPKTTHFDNRLPTFHNLLKEVITSLPNEVWVGDLTYIRTRKGFVYVSLLTDKNSRYIVGYHCGLSLGAEGAQQTLKMAISQLEPDQFPIHHTDRGCQYCCREYIKMAQARGLRMSMTETNHCAENAMAERVNGILKQEYGLDQEFANLEEVQKALQQAITLYNWYRPHAALGYQIPGNVHHRKVDKTQAPKVS